MFFPQGFVEGEGVALKIGDECEGGVGELLAVIMGRVVAGIAINQPTFQLGSGEKPMERGMAEDVFEDERIDRLGRADVGFEDFAEQLAGGFQRQLKTLDDGVAEDLVIHASRLRLRHGLQGTFEREAAALEVVEIELHDLNPSLSKLARIARSNFADSANWTCSSATRRGIFSSKGSPSSCTSSAPTNRPGVNT